MIVKLIYLLVAGIGAGLGLGFMIAALTYRRWDWWFYLLICAVNLIGATVTIIHLEVVG